MKKALLPLSLAGPGNQYCGIKEAVIMARVLDRSLVLPHIIPHYTIRDDCRSHYTFAETFNERLLIERCRDLMGLDVVPWSEYVASWPTAERLQAVNIRKDETSSRQALEYVNLYRQEMEFGLHDEEVRKSRSNRAVLDSPEAIKEWFQVNCADDPDLLVIAGLFNNLKLGGINRRSDEKPCLKNHCLRCPPSPEFDEIYQLVNLGFRLNEDIVNAGEKFIAEHFGSRPYLAFHLRICDLPRNRSFPECYSGFSEQQIHHALQQACQRYGIDPQDIFLAAPPQLFTAVSGLNLFTRQKFKTLQSDNFDSYFCALLEQHICSRSRIFLRSYTNTPDQPRKEHTRSSYSELIEGMRRGNPDLLNFTIDDFVDKSVEAEIDQTAETRFGQGISASFKFSPRG